jgi:hypothetical protein
MSWVSKRHGGPAQDYGHEWRLQLDEDRVSRRFPRKWEEQRPRVSIHGAIGNYGTGSKNTAGFDEKERLNGGKVTFYITNFPDLLPLFRLRQYVEVCGILSDVYIARQLNSHGQVYGFVRFLNVKNIDKLEQALNNLWIGELSVWAHEARFDRFAQHDFENKVSLTGGRSGRREGVVRPVVITHREGAKNVRVAKVSEEAHAAEEKNDLKWTVDGVVEKEKIKSKYIENVDAEGVVGKVKDVSVGKGTVVVVRKVRNEVKEGKMGWQPKVGVEKPVPQTVGIVSEGVLLYNSKSEDRLCATGGMVAKVISGDYSLAIQQRVGDAGFTFVVVTSMGSDRVFLHCNDGADIWNLFNDALNFFGMLFTDIHRWIPEDQQYERGAWIRVYGTPAHAWNEDFFKICVSGCGRYICSDDCTMD